MTIVADVLTDGVLMGLAVASGSVISFVFVAALVPEIAFLGVTLTSSWKSCWARRTKARSGRGLGRLRN